jgi:hypothetical protein
VPPLAAARVHGRGSAVLDLRRPTVGRLPICARCGWRGGWVVPTGSHACTQDGRAVGYTIVVQERPTLRLALAGENGCGVDDFEDQMLYGIRDAELPSARPKSLSSSGH